MKIAITLSGRCNFQCNNANVTEYIRRLYLDKLIYDHDADVFANTWTTTERHFVQSLEKIPNLKSLKLDDQDLALVEYERILNSRSDPKPPNTIPFKKNRIPNLLKMSYGLKNVITQLENYEKTNNIKYDLIIRLRYDNFIVETEVFRYNLIGNLPSDFIVMPMNFYHIHYNHFKVGQGTTVIFPKVYQSYHFNHTLNEIIPNRINSDWMHYKNTEECNSILNRIYISDNFFYGNESSRVLHKLYDYLPEIFLKYDTGKQPFFEMLMGHLCYDEKITVVNQNIIDGIWRIPLEPNVIINEVDHMYYRSKEYFDSILKRIYEN